MEEALHTLDIVEESRSSVLYKMYVSNVGNRLREMEVPSHIDMERWVWELMQNAKDSITDTPRENVDIRLIMKNNEVIFMHNGAPFQGKSYLALLYKYSDGKQNKAESTGRFGTGFLTTHCLSKVVRVEGDIDNRGEIYGFTATLYRDGNTNEELIEGIKRMEEEKLFFKKRKVWTTFDYVLKNKKNIEASELGFKNFQVNITPTMLFNTKYGVVEFTHKDGTTTKIQQKSIEEFDKVSIVTFHISSHEEKDIRFVFVRYSSHSEELSKRFNQDRNVRISGSVMLTEDNHIIVNKEIPCLFCSLPLVGGEAHIMPILIDSQDFEPDTERQGILLDGIEKKENDNGQTILTDVGINKYIIGLSVHNIFEPIVKHCSENEFLDLHLLAHGLKYVPRVNSNFDESWYLENMMKPYRKVLKSIPLVYTESGLLKIPQVSFPIYKSKDEEYKKIFY